MLLSIFPVTELNIQDAASALAALRELPLDAINVGLRLVRRQGGGSRVRGGDAGGVRRPRGESWKGSPSRGPSSPPGGATQLMGLSKVLSRSRKTRFVDATLGRPWTSFGPTSPRPIFPPTSHDPADLRPRLCPVAWYFAQVEPDGQVCFCGDFPDYFLGSVPGPLARRDLDGGAGGALPGETRQGAAPICSRCCGSWVTAPGRGRPRREGIPPPREPPDPVDNPLKSRLGRMTTDAGRSWKNMGLVETRHVAPRLGARNDAGAVLRFFRTGSGIRSRGRAPAPEGTAPGLRRGTNRP